MKLILILTLYSLAVFADPMPGGETIVLVPRDSLDPNAIVRNTGDVPCEDERVGNVPAIVVDLSKLPAVIDRSIRSGADEAWEVNGRAYIRLQDPEDGEKVRPQVNLMESDSGYIALSARGRVEFRLNSLKGSFDGKKVNFKVPF